MFNGAADEVGTTWFSEQALLKGVVLETGL